MGRADDVDKAAAGEIAGARHGWVVLIEIADIEAVVWRRLKVDPSQIFLIESVVRQAALILRNLNILGGVAIGYRQQRRGAKGSRIAGLIGVGAVQDQCRHAGVVREKRIATAASPVASGKTFRPR